MQNAKEQAIEVIHNLPDDCTMEDIQYHLYVCEKVKNGLRAIEEGRVASQEEAEKRVSEWYPLGSFIQRGIF